VLSRPVGKVAVLVHRLRADGTSIWRTLVDDVLPFNGFGQSAPPVGLIQTNDPVDGPNADRQDGQRDDGFVVAARKRLVKLDAAGALEWNAELMLAAATSQGSLAIHGLTQHCDYGRPIRCDVVAVGEVTKRDSATSSSASGFVAFVDPDGDLRTEVYPPRDFFGLRIDSQAGAEAVPANYAPTEVSLVSDAGGYGSRSWHAAG
jgi:hypothetical protein